jgi:hypothetical protein
LNQEHYFSGKGRERRGRWEFLLVGILICHICPISFFLFRNIELVLSDLTPRRASLNIARTRKCGNMKECRNSTKIQDCNSIKETYKKTSKK